MESSPEHPLAPENAESDSTQAPVVTPAPVLFGTGELGAAPAGSAAPVPEDLRVPWDGFDVVLFLAIAFGSALAVARLLQLFFAVFLSFQPEQLKDVSTASTAFAVSHQVIWSLVMLGFLWVQSRLRFRAPFWRTIGFRSFTSGDLTPAFSRLAFLLGGMLLAIAVQVASVFLRTPAKLPIEAMFQTRESVLMITAAGILVAPLVEEVMFRGFLYPVFARRWGMAAGVILTGTLFGLLHAMQLWGGWGQIALLIVVGIVLTYARARTGSVQASYLLHLGYNSLLLLGFYFVTGGWKNLPPPR